MNTAMLEAFVQVAKLESFSGAAKELGISKAQCSKLVANLEKILGTPLLERTTRRVRLTPVGACYLSDVEFVIDDLKAANTRAAQGCVPVRARIRIAAPACVSTLFLWPIFESLMKVEAELKWRLVVYDSWSPIKSRSLDCAIVFHGIEVPDAVVLREHAVPSVLVARADYLSRRGSPIHPRELISHSFFLQRGLVQGLNLQFIGPDGSGGMQRIEPIFSAGDGRLVRDAALAGQGIALLPDYLVKGELATNQLVRVLPEYALAPQRLRFLRLSGDDRRPEVRSFFKLVAGLEIWGPNGEADSETPDREWTIPGTETDQTRAL